MKNFISSVLKLQQEKSDGFNRSRGPSQSPQKTAKNNTRQKVTKAEYPTVSVINIKYFFLLKFIRRHWHTIFL